ncbi:putative reverse transcriptase [Aspergillus nomiae NRRL 13137]|uniref:Putative reverse transcriptase n=1 Tax=Aspergillus nomiae NRRL (strain ATCC 15546 / NRRL 13137 / CBS 260.88 / M93) TaxID=1509407 RepID=A0A0L1IL73_ASPN3|nr:putative reverse transcriptase [Aspergillus nomiae NRRL 13137]KNG79995.1 putative reverse transcriptase [Aspergillus nomiae NRRL 13137]
MAQFLRDPAVLQADIIAVQEPWKNPYSDTTHHPAHGSHQLLYPSASDVGDQRARVALYISRKINPRTWRHTVHSADCQELELHVQGRKLRIFNIYNPGPWDTNRTGTVELLDRVVAPRGDHIILGDFNLHHPAWSEQDAHADPSQIDRTTTTDIDTDETGRDRRTRTDRRAPKLLEFTDSRLLDLWLEPGTVTRDWNNHRSTIDLVFRAQSLADQFIACEVAPEVHADSDHLPIRTILDFSPQTAQLPKRRNWKAMDAAKLREFVADNLDTYSHWHTLRTDPSPDAIDTAADFLIEVIQRAIQHAVPWARPSTWANPNFTPECQDMLGGLRQSPQPKRPHHLPSLRRGFRRWVSEAIDQGTHGIWRVAKWARNRGTRAANTIPTLIGSQGPANTTEAKAEILREAFFPEPPPADLSDIERRVQPVQIDFPEITKEEVAKAIRRAPPDKAPGPDAIPNKIWHELLNVPVFLDRITQLFNTSIKIGHNPRHFQTSTTVALRKAAPRDYRLPKSYRPVALLNTLGKILESIVATRIAWALEEYKLLPKTHLGGRKGISADHAIQLILDYIYRAWGRDRKVSMVLLDVSGAFDNVSHTRLLFNLRQLRLGHFADWLQSFLTNRSTRISLAGELSSEFSTPTGIPQGSPLSPILYLVYNTPLIRDLFVRRPQGGSTEAYGWIDDACVLASSDSYAGNVETLKEALSRAGRWASQHASKFAPEKFELIHFTNPRKTEAATTPPSPEISPDDPDGIWRVPLPPTGHDQMEVPYADTTIKPTETAKYLGIWLDKTLSFATHRTKALAKAHGTLAALRGIAGSTWGVPLRAMRRIYQAVVIPQLFYGATAWFSPRGGQMVASTNQKMLAEFAQIQKQAALLISGAFKGTAAAALNVELYILPVHLQLQQIIEETAIRIRTGPELACPESVLKPRSARERRRSGWTPMEALSRKGGPLWPLGGRTWETRKPYILAPWEAPLETVIDSHDAALEFHKGYCARRQGIAVYTDGSGLNGRIGASAVSISRGWIHSRTLGTEGESTVYAGELTGIRMALHKLRKEKLPAIIFVDSQAAIQAVRNPQRPSGQYILGEIYYIVKRYNMRNRVQIRWIPAHIGVLGNEAADEAAREIRRRIKGRLAREWKTEKTGRTTHRLAEIPNKRVLDLYKGLSKPHASIIIQMRTQRNGLQHFLFKIKVSDSDQCHCGQGSQTSRHILLQCPLFIEPRKAMLDRLDPGIRRKMDYNGIMSHPQAMRYVAEFMHQTGLLSQFRAVEQTGHH